MRFELGADAIIGARAEQQDVVAFGTILLDGRRSARLVVVADGMGGHVGGALAASIAVEQFLRVAGGSHWSTYAETLRQATMAANRALAERIDREPRFEGMGCTIVAAALDRSTLWYVSVGDSLLLRLTGRAIERINADHSMAPLLESFASREDGGLPDDIQPHMLRSALTGRPIPLLDEGSVELRVNDRIIVASDGLLSLEPPEIVATLSGLRDGPVAGEVTALLDAVAARGLPEQDNTTVAIVRVHPSAGGRVRFGRLAGAIMLAAGIGAIGYAVWRSNGWAFPGRPAATGLAPIVVRGSTVAESETIRRAGFPRSPAPPVPAGARSPSPRPSAIAPAAAATGMVVLPRAPATASSTPAAIIPNLPIAPPATLILPPASPAPAPAQTVAPGRIGPK